MDNTMPERLWVSYRPSIVRVSPVQVEDTAEYIRADVVMGEIEKWKATASMMEQISLHHERIAERDATIIGFQTRVTELRHDLNMVIDQRNDANARIAELEAAAKKLVDASLSVIESAQSRYDLAALKRCADEAIGEAQEQRPLFDGDAINWGDLGCTGAEYRINNYGDAFHRVIIEEAAPAARKLQAFVREHLAENGFVDVNVVTEW